MRTTNGLSNAIVPSVTLGRSCVTVNEPVMRGCSANAAAPPSSGTTLPFQFEGMLQLPDRPTHVPLVCARAERAVAGTMQAAQAQINAQRERRVNRIAGNIGNGLPQVDGHERESKGTNRRRARVNSLDAPQDSKLDRP